VSLSNQALSNLQLCSGRAATDEMDAHADTGTHLPEVKVRQIGEKWGLRASIAGSRKGAKKGKRYEKGPYVDKQSAEDDAPAFAQFVFEKSRTSAVQKGNSAAPPKEGALPSEYIACVA